MTGLVSRRVRSGLFRIGIAILSQTGWLACADGGAWPAKLRLVKDGIPTAPVFEQETQPGSAAPNPESSRKENQHPIRFLTIWLRPDTRARAFVGNVSATATFIPVSTSFSPAMRTNWSSIWEFTPEAIPAKSGFDTTAPRSS
jgi:hypothetical protein